MGMLVDGQWVDKWYDTKSTGGEFKRQEQAFRHWITQDGTAGPSGDGGFEAAPYRYHLYVSLACPWAHRVLIVRALKGLEDMLPVSVVHWYMAEDGWTFADGDGDHEGQAGQEEIPARPVSRAQDQGVAEEDQEIVNERAVVATTKTPRNHQG